MSEDKAYTLACKLFNDYNYNGSQWEIDSQIDSYYNCLKQHEAETGKEYDYDKMYRLIEKEYKYKTVPSKNLLTNWQRRCIKYNFDTSKNGELALIKCYRIGTDGHYNLVNYREYTVCNNETTQKSESEVTYKLNQIFDKVATKFYPPLSHVLGGFVFIPHKYNELGEVVEWNKEKLA